MSTATTAKLMTAEEFFDWVHCPENENKWFELVRGEVIELPPPQKRHCYVTGNSTRLLGNYTFARRKAYVVSNDSGVILRRKPDTVRGPDVALYEDADKFEDLHPKYGEIPPRVAVEVLSPNDRADRFMDKITDYLESGIDMVWLLDPENRTVAVYRPDRAPRFLKESDELNGEDVLPGFRCRVADLFLLPGEQLAKKRASRKPRPKKNSG